MSIFRGDRVSVFERKSGYLFLSFSLNGEQIEKSLGKNSRERKKFAVALARKIDADLIWGRFTEIDDYLNPGKKKKNEKSVISLLSEFFDYRKKTGLKLKTLKHDAEIFAHLKKIKSLETLDEKKIKLELLEQTTPEMTRRILQKLGQALKFHEKPESVKFYKISESQKPSWELNSEKNKPVALSEIEIEKINTAILASKFHADKYFIFNFWILTGCRPSSAFAVKFSDVNLPENKITFFGSFQLGQFSSGSKKNKIYSIPISEKLREILEKYFESQNFKRDDFIFPFSKKLESYDKFFKFISKIIGKKIIPYNCRDTFITNQILRGIPLAVIAKWVDSSVSEIEKKYFDVTQIDVIPL